MVVRGKPERPVTFTALDHGHFSNGKISITVAADEFGYARADFWVGDEGDFRVLAGSPENLGPTEFTVQAVPAEVLKSLQSGQYARDYLAKLAEKAERDRLQREKAGAGGRPYPPRHAVAAGWAFVVPALAGMAPEVRLKPALRAGVCFISAAGYNGNRNWRTVMGTLRNFALQLATAAAVVLAGARAGLAAQYTAADIANMPNNACENNPANPDQCSACGSASRPRTWAAAIAPARPARPSAKS